MDPNSSNQDQNQNNTSSSSTSHVVVPPPIVDQLPPLSQNPIPAGPIQPPPVSNPAQPSVDPAVSEIPPVFSQNPNVQNPSSETPPPSDSNFQGLPKTRTISKKTAAILVALFFVVSIPLTVFVAKQPQTTDIGAANPLTPDTLIAVFNGQKIYEKDLEKVAAEQNDPDAIDKEALKDALDTLIQRKVLDLEKQEKGIEVSQDEISQKAAEQDLESNQAYYEVLKDKVTMLDVQAMKVASVGFWSPKNDNLESLTADEKTLASRQAQQGSQALSEVETRLTSGEDLLTIAQSIALKYPVVGPAISINGYILDTLSESERQSLSSYEIIEKGNADLDNSIRTGLFAMAENEVKTFENTETNKGGFVFKILQKGSDSGFATYDAWLKSKENSLVVKQQL